MSIDFRATHLFLAAVVVLGVAIVGSERSVVRAERRATQDTQKKGRRCAVGLGGVFGSRR